ncbi:MAG TPA: hypothetical protein DCY64_11745 [Hydrogenophaga sp.]|uniref:hypothetical protein n=1 Tax=Hydrogenophaga sp. TaxID=1904254 RepID=UPI0008B01FF3|nr:hypothetical protein [Hydrogenophaga sp.]OGA75964.1 MAG: hypothetical protein A2X73_18385 [Burkholderiales bacterium GWE1_65_30]OGA89886.1 MAG: hypothetical protein A2X72_12595 [Burkholderiales bacterium GWF1_66_17]HAX20941.1 hypothetical protein [Hydrogenophaga sp.]
MNTHNPDFVTVDMRGLKTALVAHAQSRHESVSVLVRRAVARELGQAESLPQPITCSEGVGASRQSQVKLSIRLTTNEAEQLAAGSRAAGLSRGAYLAGLIAGIPALTTGANRTEMLSALTTSNAQLSSLSRNIHALTRLLTQSNVQKALVYRDMLDTLDGDIHRHLTQAAALMSDLRPRGSSAATTHSTNR